MGKLKLAKDLIKLNNKLGLLDVGDVFNLATTAYKVKNFNPTDHLPEFDFLVDKEMEKAERRKTLLLAGAAAGVGYFLYSNRKGISKALEGSKSEKLAKDVSKKAEKALDEGKDLVEDAKEKGEDVAEDAKKKGKELAHEAEAKAKEVKEEVEK